MPVWRYMELCLTHPQHGYYVARDPLGREGDFTTSPEVSQMFGELLRLWTASVWKAIDSPSVLRLIELGPGRGTMMSDALRALRVLPPLYQSLTDHLVEINPQLRDKQKSTLAGGGGECTRAPSARTPEIPDRRPRATAAPIPGKIPVTPTSPPMSIFRRWRAPRKISGPRCTARCRRAIFSSGSASKPAR